MVVVHWCHVWACGGFCGEMGGDGDGDDGHGWEHATDSWYIWIQQHKEQIRQKGIIL